MGLEQFIPPDSEISSKQVFAGMIYHVDTFYASVLFYKGPEKNKDFSKCMFACPEEDIRVSSEVRVHYWTEKDGTKNSIVEVVKDDG